MIFSVFYWLQLFGIVISFSLVLLIAHQKPSDNQKILLLATICAFVAMVAYYFELRSTTVREGLLAVKFGYTGKCFVMVLFLIFVAKYCAVNIRLWMIRALMTFSSLMLVLIYTNEYHHLYYRSASLVRGKGYWYLNLVKGPAYYVFMIVLLSIMMAFSIITVRHWLKSEGYERKRVLYLGLSGIFPAIALCIYLSGILSGYDPIQLCLMASCFFVILTVFKYGLFDTIQIAKENIVTNTEQGMIVVNENYEFLFANPAAYMIFPQIKSAERHELGAWIKRIFSKEQNVCEKEGRYYEIRVSTLYEDKVPRGYMAWIFDMTYLNEYTRKLIQLKEEAEDANRAKSIFLSNISEEIRNPMNKIVEFSNSMIHREVNETWDKELQRRAVNVKESTDMLLHICNDIIDISKIEAGKMELVPVAYQTKTLLQKTLSGITKQTEEKGLQFIVDIDQNLPVELYGDNFRIQEVLTNLLSNAIKYTEHGGITFKVEMGSQRRGYVTVIYSVEDTGIGIEEDKLEYLFHNPVLIDQQQFRQKGTGLGLSITKSLVDMMGGQLECESAYGIGTMFTVSIEQKILNAKSLKESKQERIEYKDIQTRPVYVQGAEVLVVDGNEVNAKLTEGLLRFYDLSVTITHSGKKALDLVTDNEFAMVLMDENAPELNGLNTMKRIRQMKGRKYLQLPMILLTANKDENYHLSCINDGFNSCLTKPLDVIELEKLLRLFIPTD